MQEKSQGKRVLSSALIFVIAVNALPKLYELGDIIDAEDIDKLVYDNSARILAY